MTIEPPLQSDVVLAPLTTVELGGPARWLVQADDERTILDAHAWAREHGHALVVLGGGSNVVVADRGLDALVVRIATRGIDMRREADSVLVTVAAGEPWDELVAHAVDAGLAGIECLSGIPGLVGATPIQNVGAYGQDVAETIRSVRILERATGAIRTMDASECQLGYRDSVFKRDPRRAIVLAVTFELRPGGAPHLRYAELRRALAVDDAEPSLVDVRAGVLALRRAKSMVLDPHDENRRSVGSFFTNPIVTEREAADVASRALAAGVVRDAGEVPRWPERDGRVKLAAGWLIEQAGIPKGLRAGRVGVSTRHALALVHYGGGTASELLALARRVRDAVLEQFGVRLEPEPALLGFPPAERL